MSIDYVSYLGAFVRLTPKMVSTTKQIRACSNPQCNVKDKFQTANFCPKCGSKIEDVVIPFEQEWNYWQWADEKNFTDILRKYEMNGVQYLFPNTRRTPAQVVDVDSAGDDACVELGNVDADQYLDAFKSQYRDILASLDASGIAYEVLFGFFKTAY